MTYLRPFPGAGFLFSTEYEQASIERGGVPLKKTGGVSCQRILYN